MALENLKGKLLPVRAGGYGGGGGGGGASIPSPPCPKNYLFGCHPVVTTVPCGGAASKPTPKPCDGAMPAYSHHIPTFLEAPWNVLYTYQISYPLTHQPQQQQI
ncbi:vitelline membrane protein Vm26Aa-like isoform 1-T3 [Cochliomyia hominivorax]